MQGVNGVLVVEVGPIQGKIERTCGCVRISEESERIRDRYVIGDRGQGRRTRYDVELLASGRMPRKHSGIFKCTEVDRPISGAWYVKAMTNKLRAKLVSLEVVLLTADVPLDRED